MINASWGILRTRTKALERQRQRQAVMETAKHSDQFLVTPTCPPSQRLQIRSGIPSPVQRWGYIIAQSYTEPQMADFADTVQMGAAYTFSTVGGYLPILLCYWGEWLAYRVIYEGGPFQIDQVFDNVVGDEASTAAAAEAEIDALLNGAEAWYDYRLPLWAVILRNDGHTGIEGAMLPVDKINRGRSYLYRDIRARNSLGQ